MFGETRRIVRDCCLYVATAAFAGVAIAPSKSATPAPHPKTFTVEGYKFVVPAASPMQHWRVISEPGMYGAEFKSKVLLTGTLYYTGPLPHGYDSGSDPAAFSVDLDKASLALLPYWKDDGHPQGRFDIEVKPSTQAAILPAALRSNVNGSKGTKVAAGRVSLHIDSYTVFVDGCGVSESSLDGESIDHASAMQLMTAPPAEEGEDC